MVEGGVPFICVDASETLPMGFQAVYDHLLAHSAFLNKDASNTKIQMVPMESPSVIKRFHFFSVLH